MRRRLTVVKHVDDDGREWWSYHCYVVELKKAACSDRRAPCRGACGDKVPVYVGQSAHEPRVRLEQHRSEVRASRWVRLYGLHLRPRLAGRIGELLTKEAALAAERALGEKLRKRGFCVYGAH